MKNIFEFIAKNAPLVKHYANLIIHAIDMLDGVQNWRKDNPPPKVK
ncbi:hypothetical protein [Chryseobacterium defluvii]|uniref:Uncharacterized protein n=1 Tax=Chryseobacterium defluvii TaxID=160396 RepID=A0A495SDH4_9FLAO|nr:hypothetical protein [Chryseobacterium defluvii]RKS98237.1 hypothetical protein BCF58_2378 [Chryseobacterium defluvii]